MIPIRTLAKGGIWAILVWVAVLPTAIAIAQESEQTFDPVESIYNDRYTEVMDRLSDGRLNPNLVVNTWYGYTVMHLVAPATLDFLRMAVAKGGNCGATDNFGETPLHFAASQGVLGPGPDSIRVLIECGADVNAQNSRGKTPLHAAYSGEFGREQYGPDFANYANLGLGHQRLDIIEALLKGGADPNIRDNNQDTLLFVVFKSNTRFFSQHVRLMLDGGADPNLRDSKGDTPLILAAINRNDIEDETAQLLAGGADPCLRNSDGKLPYELAEKGSKVKGLLYEAGGYFDENLGMCARETRVLVERENNLNLSQNDRKRIQSCLKRQGFDPGSPDGVFGPRTRKALQDWQTSEGFTGPESVAYLTAGQAESLLEACKVVVRNESDDEVESSDEKTEYGSKSETSDSTEDSSDYTSLSSNCNEDRPSVCEEAMKSLIEAEHKMVEQLEKMRNEAEPGSGRVGFSLEVRHVQMSLDTRKLCYSVEKRPHCKEDIQSWIEYFEYWLRTDGKGEF